MSACWEGGISGQILCHFWTKVHVVMTNVKREGREGNNEGNRKAG